MPDSEFDWVGSALRTGPADRAVFEAAARACYFHAGLPWPGEVVWVASPLVMAIAAPWAAVMLEYVQHPYRRLPEDDLIVLLDGLPLDECVAGRLIDGEPGESFANSSQSEDGTDETLAMFNAMHRALTVRLRDLDLLETLEAVISMEVQAAVRRAAGRVEVGEEHQHLLRRTLENCWRAYLGCQFGSRSWLAHHHPLAGPRARAFRYAATTACCWWPHERFVIAAEHPIELHTERVGDPTTGLNAIRLHRGDGPAVRWADGWELHAIHGTLVPAKVTEAPETITSYDVLETWDAGVRRVMLDRLGVERFLAGVWKDLLDDDPEWGRLWRLAPLRSWDEPTTMVECINATPEPDGSFKRYLLEVPPFVRTAREALAWTFDLPAERYTPVKQT